FSHAEMAFPDRTCRHGRLLFRRLNPPARQRFRRWRQGTMRRPALFEEDNAAEEPVMDKNKHAEQAADAVEKQHRIQVEVDENDRERTEEEESGAMQAGARAYPVPPFPQQHQAKPGDEAALEPAPLYDAPFWRGSG